MANVFSVIRNVSVPFGEADPNAPNISPTIWRTAADNINRVYYFESTLSPSIVWVELDKLDLSPGAGVLKLEMVGNYEMTGNVTKQFAPAKQFEFLGPQ